MKWNGMGAFSRHYLYRLKPFSGLFLPPANAIARLRRRIASGPRGSTAAWPALMAAACRERLVQRSHGVIGDFLKIRKAVRPDMVAKRRGGLT